MRLLFTGFNAFGQHEFVSGDVDSAAGFREINAPVSDQNQCTISVGWGYSAVASGRKLYLRGLLDSEPNESVTLEALDNIKALSAGDSNCLVLLQSGQLYRVQPKLNAELLAVRLESPPHPNAGTKRSIFGTAKEPQPPIVEHIACGTHINVAISSENAVYSIPSCLHQFPGRQFRVKQLECGNEHAVLLNGNGDVFTWGNGLRGQLGQAVLKVEETPQLVEALAGIKITHISAGGWHSAGISAFGDLYTWGLNCSGQLGMRVMKPGGLLKEPTVYPLPQLHDLPECGCTKSGENECAPLQVVAGSRHTLLVRACGRLWVSGWSWHGQLGKPVGSEFVDAFQALGGICLDTNTDRVLCGAWATLLYLGKR
ncbi:hypothetical protein KR009_010594 [Drosophila setifemur]|nr:hypothetical protein KR009_010594 [Drosophila setifemur]